MASPDPPIGNQNCGHPVLWRGDNGGHAIADAAMIQPLLLRWVQIDEQIADAVLSIDAQSNGIDAATVLTDHIVIVVALRNPKLFEI